MDKVKVQRIIPGAEEIIERHPFSLVADPKEPGTVPRSHDKGGPEGSNAYPESVPVEKHIGTETGEDGRVKEKVVRETQSAGAGMKNHSEAVTGQSGKESPAEQGPEETEEEEMTKNPDCITGMEEDLKDEEPEPIKVQLSCGGFDLTTEYVDIYLPDGQEYAAVFYNPDDRGLILPQQEREFDLKTSASPPLTCKFTGIDIPVTRSDLRVRVLEVIKHSEA